MGKKLTVFMTDGTEFGPRIVEIGNWVGKGVYCPRVAVSSVLARSEVNNPGIYFLKSLPGSDAYTERIYIGEAENVGARLRQHLADPNKDFEELAFFVSKDELLTKTQIKFLETKFIQQAHEARSAEIVNGNVPSLPTLHEADISDMEYFREQVKLILPVMGFRFLLPTVVQPSAISPTGLGAAPRGDYYIRSPQFTAQMYETDQGYVVRAGSQANKVMTPSLSNTYRRLRQQFIESGILVEAGNYLTFSEDTVFSSPSAASNLVLGRQSAGPIEWVNDDQKTYKEVSEELTGSTPNDSITMPIDLAEE